MQRRGRMQGHKHGLDHAGQQIVDRLIGAPVRHVPEIGARHCCQLRHPQMLQSSAARRAIVEPFAPIFCIGKKLLEIPSWKLGVNTQRKAGGAHQGNRREVCQHINAG
ncbi:hypothetical protein D3C71_1521220 [compost metagenome]